MNRGIHYQISAIIKSAQAHIKTCIQALSDKSKNVYKEHQQALKTNIEQLSTLINKYLRGS